MARRYSSDDTDDIGFAIFIVLGILWLLRWIIVAVLAVIVVAFIIRFAVRRYDAHVAAVRARMAALRQRAEIQNAQVLRGDPAGFYGAYPLPDPELIPRWYKAG